MIVLLDTNILLAPARLRLDVFGSIEKLLEQTPQYLVLSPCLAEIKSLAAKHVKDAPAARTALELIKTYKICVVEAQGKPDEAILAWAKANASLKPIVCTDDKLLRDKLRKSGARVACVREKNRIVFC